MATAQDIIDAAFRKIGMQDPTSADRTYALINLNNRLSGLGAEMLNHYDAKETAYTLTAGTDSYTIGSGGNIDTTRPIKIVSAFLRDSDGYDYPLKVENVRKYDEVYYKTWEGRPEFLYYSPEYPLGKIYFDCEPDTTYSLYLTCRRNFTEFSALTTTVTLPNEFKELLVYELTISLAEDKGIVIRPSIYDRAKEMKESIAWLSAINMPVMESSTDFGNGKAFNITTGEYE